MVEVTDSSSVSTTEGTSLFSEVSFFYPKGKGSPYFQPQLSLLRTRTNYGFAVAYSTYSPKADSSWQVDAFGVRNFGSTMPECKHSVAAFALYAFVALVRMATRVGLCP